ncbi:hypothetical protein ACFXPQ_20345 [Streptomyces lydicus]|uniref:hypothetical protein n=1 Tax=Streptomyces lydicus TaxID=47763 RepID=UPI0036D07FB9
MVSPGDTTYGNNNSSYDSSSSSSSDDPQHYQGGAYDDTSKGTVDTSQTIPVLPKIPVTSTSGGGDVSVDTTALKKFADNLDTIAEVVRGAMDRVDHIGEIRPGTFTEADALKAKISGPGGLKEGLVKAMHDVRQSLMDIADKIRTLANKYSTLEELNGKAGNELHQLIQDAQTDLQSFQRDSAVLGQQLGADKPSSSRPSTTTTA